MRMRSFPARSIFPCLHSEKRRRQTSWEAASPGVGLTMLCSSGVVRQDAGHHPMLLSPQWAIRLAVPSTIITGSHQLGHWATVSQNSTSLWLVCIKSRLISTQLRQVCETMEGKKWSVAMHKCTCSLLFPQIMLILTVTEKKKKKKNSRSFTSQENGISLHERWFTILQFNELVSTEQPEFSTDLKDLSLQDLFIFFLIQTPPILLVISQQQQAEQLSFKQ